MAADRRPSRPIQWDIYEEHLDEAAWLWGMWEAALDSAIHTLAEVAEGPEERLLAHLDGLVLGGKPVAEKLLLPALAGDDPGGVAAAAWSLVQAEDADHQHAVFEALAAGEPPARAAIARALALSPNADRGRATKLWSAGDIALRAAALEVIGARDPGWLRAQLDPIFRGGEPALLAPAVRLLRAAPDPDDAGYVEDALRSTDPDVRGQAIVTGIALRSRAAWEACRKAATQPGDANRVPLGLLAGSADPADRAGVRTRAGHADFKHHALWALGFAGDLESADAAVAAMSDADERAAKLGAEAMAAMTGLPLAGRFVTPGETQGPDVPEVGDDDAPPVVNAEDHLPLPNAAEIGKWWADERRRYAPGSRYVQGQQRTPEALRATLLTAPTWRRQVLWTELAATTPGPPAIDLRGWAKDQQRKLA